MSPRRNDRRALPRIGMCALGLAVLLAVPVGCAPPDYVLADSDRVPSWISSRERWEITGSDHIRDAAKAIDGSRRTAAISGTSYDKAYVTIDLGKPCFFNLVVIEHGRDEFGFCRKVAVLTSTDNNTYTLQQSEPGTRRVSIVSLIDPVVARYVRIRAEAEGERPWSIAEIHLQ